MRSTSTTPSRRTSEPEPAATLQEQEQMGVACAIFPAMTTSVGLQAVWELLNDFMERGPVAMAERAAAARASKWGPVRFDTFAQLSQADITRIEGQFLPK